MSGTFHGAGGVGGLLAIDTETNGVHFVGYDGNGNVSALVNAADGTISAQYEYGPFGETLRAESLVAKANPLRFSTKYRDEETDWVYYGYRYHCPASGRWLSRDPAVEAGGVNLYAVLSNDMLNSADFLGLWETAAHHDIVDRWLPGEYEELSWRCCALRVRAGLKDGSDAVDGVGGHWIGFANAQSSRTAYQHAMRGPFQATSEAQFLYGQFVYQNVQNALTSARKARERKACLGNDTPCCAFMRQAIDYLGRAFHAYSDSLSPSHAGFQPWYGPYDGALRDGTDPQWYLRFIKRHHDAENMNVYFGMAGQVVESVKATFQTALDEILKE